MASIGAFSIFLLTFKVPFQSASIGLDPSYDFGLNYFFANHIKFGEDVVCSWGPLAFLAHTLPIGNNLFWSLWFWICVRLLTISLFVRYFFGELHIKSHWGQIVLTFILMTCLFNLFTPYISLIYAALISAMLFYSKQRNVYFVLSVVIVSLVTLIKFGIGLIAFSFIFVPLVFANLKPKLIFFRAIYALLLCLISITVIWFLIYGQLDGLVDFFYASYEFSAGYSSAVSLEAKNRWLVLLTGVLMFYISQYFILEKQHRILLVASIMPLIIYFRYSFVRPDHVIGIIDFFIYFSIILMMTIRKYSRFLPSAVILFICLKFISASFSLYPYWIVKTWSVENRLTRCIAVDGPKEIWRKIFHFDEEKKRLQKISSENLSPLEVYSDYFNKASQATVDIFPSELNIVHANKLNWKPRKIIQSYNAYTLWLDHQNSKCFSESNGPEYLIFHKLNTIDGRYLLNDVPMTIYEIFKNYRAVGMKKFLYLKRMGEPFLATPHYLSEMTCKWDEWIEVPKYKHGIIRAKFNYRTTLKGVFRKRLFKEGPFLVHYKFEDGNIATHRFVAATAQNGLWISPYLLMASPNSCEQIEPLTYINREDVSCKIEVGAAEFGYIVIKGWTIVNDTSKSTKTKSIILRDRNCGRFYRCSVCNKNRGYFKKYLGYSYDESSAGFFAELKINSLEPGEYDIGLELLIENEVNGFFTQSKVLVPDDSTMLHLQANGEFVARNVRSIKLTNPGAEYYNEKFSLEWEFIEEN